MERKNQHYYTQFPDTNLKMHTVSESMRKHLFVFKTVSGIFSFKKIDLGTKILIEHMTIPEEPSVLLDLGCGYGPIGIVLGYISPKSNIYFIDLNRRATWCCKGNVKINFPYSQKRFKILTHNYFDAFKNKNIKFEAIYMNPPMRRGKKEFINLCKEIPKYLKSNGFFQFVIRKKLGAPSIFEALKNINPQNKIEVLFKRSGYWVFNWIFD